MIVTTHWDTGDAQFALRRRHTMLRERVRQAVHDTGTEMATTMARMAPQRTGNLADSILVDHEMSDGWGAVTVYTDTIYARRIEYGFHGADSLGRVYNQSGQPYWAPGFQSQVGPFQSRLQAALAF